MRFEHATAPARREDHKGPITVYGGGERSRVQGISWTRSRAVAQRFARGFRGPRVADPIVAKAWVPRCAIFLYDNSRREREVLLDPTNCTT